MSKLLPEVRIIFSHLLYENVSPVLAKNMNAQMPSFEDCEDWIANYNTEWSKYESDILQGIIDILGLNFRRASIDANVAPFFRPQSDPLIISFASYPDEFVDVLTHELIHILLTDNNKMSVHDADMKLNLVDEWQSFYGKDFDFATLVHIPVHAVLKYVYLDVLKDKKRFERDVKNSSEYSDSAPYTVAWKYVNNNDYKDIVRQLKNSYASI